jgi:hypothetical protein
MRPDACTTIVARCVRGGSGSEATGAASSQQVAGCSVPLGDIRIVGPAVMAVLAIILIVRTRGVYTRWLAANIIVCALALTYVLDPNVFQELLRQGVQEGMNQIR